MANEVDDEFIAKLAVYSREKGAMKDMPTMLLAILAMEELAAKDTPVIRSVMSRPDAIKLFESMGEQYKVEIIGSIPGEEDLSFYQQNDFIDLCRGPHVPSLGKLKAYWA